MGEAGAKHPLQGLVNPIKRVGLGRKIEAETHIEWDGLQHFYHNGGMWPACLVQGLPVFSGEGRREFGTMTRDLRWMGE